MKPDATLRVRFLTEKEGGRSTPILGHNFGCPVMVGESGYDCRFVIEKSSTLELGRTYDISVKFLSPALAKSAIPAGTDVTLWEGKTIAIGYLVDWKVPFDTSST